MKAKKLTATQIKKINDEIRRLQYKSWDSSVEEVNKIRDQIHVLRKKLDDDILLKIQSQKTAPKKPASKTKKGLKAPATKTPAKRKKSVSARTICRKVIDVPGINKRTGQLLKGWHYVNGKPVKAIKPKKEVKKKATTKKK